MSVSACLIVFVIIGSERISESEQDSVNGNTPLIQIDVFTGWAGWGVGYF